MFRPTYLSPSRLARLAAGALALLALAAGAGCNRNGDSLEVVSETDEKQYQYAEQMLKEDRSDEALAAFLRVIQKRPDDAPESHLAAGQLCLNYKHDPIEAIHHFQIYLAAKPNSEQAPMVHELIDTAKKDFARTLPGLPYHAEFERLDLLDEIKTLTAQNEELQREVAALQQGGGGHGGGISLQSLPQAPAENVAVAPVSAGNVSEATTSQSSGTKAAARSYTVEAGDTLSSISSKMYGSKQHWKEILDANAEVLKSPRDLKPGQVLKIP
ncbi:MAG: LysM peptidoglycan-binding domain-containing protein [Opitutales bacterium]|jgi:LysM repeat protein